jgi:probable O-glycosylation ligase (exosortase A-associated)
MRDLMMLGAMFFLIPMALRNAFAAYLIWGWTAFIAIDEYLYGFMTSMRMNMLFALITLGLLFINSRKLEGQWTRNRTNTLLIIWFVHGTLSAIFAYTGVASNWVLYEKLAKVLIFVLIMPLIVYGRFRIHSFVIALCLGIGFHALIEGLKYINSGGAHHVQGLAKFGDNNLFAVMILMGMPLLLYIYRQSANRLTKIAALSGAGLTIAAVMGTHSRGGMLAMVAAGMWLILTGRRKLLTLTVAGAMVAVVITFAPSSWLERMDTIQTADQDASFLGRIEAWQISSAMALSNPVLGGGFHAIENANVWGQFRGSTGLLGFLPNYQFSPVNFRAAHSAYFEVMGDRGLLGFLIFIAILANTIFTTFETRRLARAAGPGMAWASDLATALSAVMIAYAAGGAGVSVAYAEMLYVVAILSEILKHHVLTEGPKAPARIKY